MPATSGQQQPQAPLTHHAAAVPIAEREPHARPGDHEQQRHAQSMGDAHRELQCREHFGVLDVPAPADEQHAGVEKEQDENCDDPQPVEKVVAVRSGC
jgi:hypothetical protein